MDKLPIIISHSNLDLYEFSKVVEEWHIDFIQLGGGSFLSSLDQVLFPEFQLARVFFNSRVKQEGRSPKGYWTFTFVNNEGLIWRNFDVSPHSIIIYAPDSEINGVSSVNFNPFIFSIHEDILKHFIKQTNSEEVLKILDKEILSIDPTLWESIKNQIQKGIEKFKSNKNDDGKSHFLGDFTMNLINAIKESTYTAKKVSSTNRLQLLVNAEQYILEQINHTISIKVVAEQCGVSERTLLYAFKKRYGIGPKAYKKLLKLNYVYRLLNKGIGGCTIANTARHYGFWHIGQFNKDYKNLFGEVPSETITRQVGRVG